MASHQESNYEEALIILLLPDTTGKQLVTVKWEKQISAFLVLLRSNQTSGKRSLGQVFIGDQQLPPQRWQKAPAVLDFHPHPENSAPSLC